MRIYDTISDYATNLLSILTRLQKRDALTVLACFDHTEGSQSGVLA